MRHVRLHRRTAHDQPVGDLGVREPASQELEHLPLALGERVAGRRGPDPREQLLGRRALAVAIVWAVTLAAVTWVAEPAADPAPNPA
jgi:hypothetical protein